MRPGPVDTEDGIGGIELAGRRKGPVGVKIRFADQRHPTVSGQGEPIHEIRTVMTGTAIVIIGVSDRAPGNTVTAIDRDRI